MEENKILKQLLLEIEKYKGTLENTTEPLAEDESQWIIFKQKKIKVQVHQHSQIQLTNNKRSKNILT